MKYEHSFSCKAQKVVYLTLYSWSSERDNGGVRSFNDNPDSEEQNVEYGNNFRPDQPYWQPCKHQTELQ